MAMITIEIKEIYTQTNHLIEIESNGTIDSFLHQITDLWKVADTAYAHRLFSLSDQRVLNGQKTWKENGTIPGDSFLLF